MGQRSEIETVAAVFRAFYEKRSWVQAELARKLEMTPAGLRKRLQALQAQGWALHAKPDHPHVVWSVDDGWFGDGMLLSRAQVRSMLEQLVQLPRSSRKDKLLAAMLGSAGRAMVGAQRLPAAVAAPTMDDRTADLLVLCTEAVADQRALQIEYHTMSTGTRRWRVVSPQKVVTGDTAQMVAWCHERNELRWFRLDQTLAGHPAPAVAFRACSAADVERFLAESAKGFRSDGPALACVFAVSEDDWRSVERNLPTRGATALREAGRVVVTVRTGAMEQLARYLLGMGDRAEARSPELRARMIEIARGALRSLERATAASDPERRETDVQ